jgi:predicted dinucleotide-binding enzyme
VVFVTGRAKVIIGGAAVDLGGLGESWRVDPGPKAFVAHQTAGELRANALDALRVV